MGRRSWATDSCMLNCPTTCAGALDNVNAELEKLSAKIDAVEKEIGDTMVELRTARENGDAGEVGRQSKREEALRDKEKLLLEERRALRERGLPAPGALPQAPPSAPGNF